MKDKHKHRFAPAILSKEDVRTTYARLSRIYDCWGLLTESSAARRALQLADIKNGESILEVAVGTGRAFERIVSINKEGRNEGTELSPEMLEVARKRLQRRNSNYTLVVADASSLPYADGAFDLLMNSYMFDLLPEDDFAGLLLEFKRVLRPGGRIVITSMTQGRTWYSRMWDRLLRKAPNILVGCRPVSLTQDIERARFSNVHEEYVSQFTFPSSVIIALKPISDINAAG